MCTPPHRLEAASLGARQMLAHYLAAPAQQHATLIAQLRPRATDYRAVFAPVLAATSAERGYVQLWGNEPVWPVPNEPQLEVYAATANEIAKNARGTQAFPAGYLDIACWLRPSVIWIAWSVKGRGNGHGTLYDGLVEIEPGRWAWFPRPWKVLPPPAHSSVYWE